MSFDTRTVNDLLRLAAAGGGFKLNAATRTTNDLIRIAAAASGKNARIILTNVDTKTVDDLIRISAAGKGSVFFE